MNNPEHDANLYKLLSEFIIEMSSINDEAKKKEILFKYASMLDPRLFDEENYVSFKQKVATFAAGVDELVAIPEHLYLDLKDALHKKYTEDIALEYGSFETQEGKI